MENKTIYSGLLIITIISCILFSSCKKEEPNTPPIASFSISPENGNTDTIFVFDASGSTDKENTLEDLKFRWDWETDGSWDTDYTNKSTATHQFTEEGNYSVNMEVMDSDSLISSFGKQLDVSLAIHYPEIPNNPFPADNATGIDISFQLTWSCSHPDGDVLRYKVYLGEEIDPPSYSHFSSDNYSNVYYLEYDKTYYWKVIAKDENENTTEGPLWSFTIKSDVCALYWQVCSGDGLDDAATYPGGNNIHPIVVCGTELNIPSEWLPPSFSKTELVACISKSNSVVQLCNYTNGGTFTRYKRRCSINLHAAKTGELIASTILYGGEPGPCPGTLIGMSSWVYGSAISDSRIINWLSQYVVE